MTCTKTNPVPSAARKKRISGNESPNLLPAPVSSEGDIAVRIETVAVLSLKEGEMEAEWTDL